MMKTKLTLLAFAWTCSLLMSASSGAATYNYSGTITSCSDAFCASDPNLQAGAVITGFFDISTIPGATVGDSALTSFGLSITNGITPEPTVFGWYAGNPAFPTSPSVGSSITTDGSNNLIAGSLNLRFLEPDYLLAADIFAVFDLATGAGQTCASFSTLGCLSESTVMVIPGVRPSEAEWDSQRGIVIAYFGYDYLGPYPTTDEQWLAVQGFEGIELLFPDLPDTTQVVGATVLSTFEGSFTQAPALVPLPATAWLFGSALLGLGVLKRRKA